MDRAHLRLAAAIGHQDASGRHHIALCRTRPTDCERQQQAKLGAGRVLWGKASGISWICDGYRKSGRTQDSAAPLPTEPKRRDRLLSRPIKTQLEQI